MSRERPTPCVPIRLTKLVVAGLLAISISVNMGPVTAAAAQKGDGAVEYIALPTMSVSLLERNRIRGVLSLTVSLEVGGETRTRDVKKQLPRLRDAYLRTLSNLAQTHLDPQERINMNLLRKVLQRTTDRLFGPDAVSVLVQHALIRNQ